MHSSRCLVVVLLDCQSGFLIPVRTEICLRFLLHLHSLVNSAVSTRERVRADCLLHMSNNFIKELLVFFMVLKAVVKCNHFNNLQEISINTITFVKLRNLEACILLLEFNFL